MSLKISLLLKEEGSAKTRAEVVKLLLTEKLVVKKMDINQTGKSNEVRLDTSVHGVCDDASRLVNLLNEHSDVISVIDVNHMSHDVSVDSTAPVNNMASSADVKAECARLLISFFGDHGADEIQSMTPQEAIEYGKGKVTGLIGAEAAKAFDSLVG